MGVSHDIRNVHSASVCAPAKTFLASMCSIFSCGLQAALGQLHAFSAALTVARFHHSREIEQLTIDLVLRRGQYADLRPQAKSSLTNKTEKPVASRNTN